LRNVAEEGFAVGTGGGATGPSRRIANLSLQQAIREAFPGAVYLHMARGWKVFEWRSTTWERMIRVASTNMRVGPKPLLRTFVEISLESDGIITGRFRKGDTGFLAECQLKITERVEGLVDRGERKLYRDLQIDDPNMRPKTREFRTTGIALQITQPWFARKGVKERVAEVLAELLRREYSISPTDVDHAATNIALVRDGQRRSATDAIVIYDATHGSLRLSEPAYTRLDLLIERLKAAASMIPDDFDLLPVDDVKALESWISQLGPEANDLSQLSTTEDAGNGVPGWLQVYAPGSIVCRRNVHNHLVDIIAPELTSLDESLPTLFYRYKSPAAVKALTPASQVEAVGDQWSFAYWNPETGDYADAVDDLVARDVDRPVALSDSLSGPEV
jgi:DEAD/DEAH box helicase domain-containing protein